MSTMNGRMKIQIFLILVCFRTILGWSKGQILLKRDTQRLLNCREVSCLQSGRPGILHRHIKSENVVYPKCLSIAKMSKRHIGNSKRKPKSDYQHRQRYREKEGIDIYTDLFKRHHTQLTKMRILGVISPQKFSDGTSCLGVN